MRPLFIDIEPETFNISPAAIENIMPLRRPRKRAYDLRMSEAADELLKRALRLSEQDRASLAETLIESLHGDAEPGTEQAWDAEIRRRVHELETRAVETVAWSKVRERLFRGFA